MAAEAGMGFRLKKSESRGGGMAAEAGMGFKVVTAAKRSRSWFTNPSLISSSSDLEISSSVKHGDSYIDADLFRLKDMKVTPAGLYHYRVPGDNNPKIWHHYGVVAVRLSGLQGGPSFLTDTLIMFEKGILKDAEKRKVGGKVTVKIFNQTCLLKAKTETILEEKLKDCQEIVLQELLDILTSMRTLSYSVWKNNCWKYVFDCQDEMLRAFAELPGTSPACKEALEKLRQQLRRPLLLSDVFNWKVLFVTLFTTFRLSVQPIRIFDKAVKFAVKIVKVMSVKGLGPSLSYPIAYIWKKLKKLKKLGLKGSATKAAKALLGLLNWIAVAALGAFSFFIFVWIQRLIFVASENTTHPWTQWFPDLAKLSR